MFFEDLIGNDVIDEEVSQVNDCFFLAVISELKKELKMAPVNRRWCCFYDGRNGLFFVEGDELGPDLGHMGLDRMILPLRIEKVDFGCNHRI